MNYKSSRKKDKKMERRKNNQKNNLNFPEQNKGPSQHHALAKVLL